MKRILVLAYAISPTRGSEYSVAWNYVRYISKNNHVTIIYGTSGDNIGNVEEMEDYLKKHTLENADFISVLPNRTTRALNWLNVHGYLTYSFYLAFQSWQKQVYTIAKELIKQRNFDVIHLVGPIGYREPGYLWKLGLPYVWGPIGGANNSPLVLMKQLSVTNKLKHGFRTLANAFQIRYSIRLKKALANTDILLTATSGNQKIFKKIHGEDSICLPENAITGNIQLNKDKFINPPKYNFIVVGSLDARKSVNIFLEAITQVKYKELIHINIVGNGPLMNVWQKYAKDHGIDNLITWHGQLPREKAIQMFQSSHLHVITSISEGNPTTIWEAMSLGVPTLSFDHCGMHDTLREGAGILIPIASSYNACVMSVVAAINDLLEHPARFQKLADATISRANKYTWNERAKLLDNIYERAIQIHNSKQ
ncbi:MULTISPECIES: glycosyltransferase family 4 protein [Bacteroides]|uniref:glycosyltransferase family 4 protein n=2 Tax=Bacteroides TaxID=816 RepID=UPI00189C92F0|nr:MULTISPECIES: glycosyltransferase [Bacteroides]MDC1767444.1 glycosyltransferase [Bacteroides uniformis]MDC1771068.1 glycosyltransferase [Bacteroides uniformis]MDC1777306.1 glycosyltransferase [Bacteroides uniformis]MDC1778796.1 glycosyltransferase [Bacteroides uniformis]